jgi:uncharacterized membrane protein
MTPAPSVGNVHRVAEGCHGTLAAAAPLGQRSANLIGNYTQNWPLWRHTGGLRKWQVTQKTFLRNSVDDILTTF